jgi:hypothetical protein
MMPDTLGFVFAVLALITKLLTALRQSVALLVLIMGTSTNGVSQGESPRFIGGPN